MKARFEWEALRPVIERGYACGMTDAEVAATVGCKISILAVHRVRWGIRRADRFVRKFRVLYGDAAIEQFALFVEECASLASIGRHFGFTREYARQVKKHLMRRGLLNGNNADL